MVAVSVDKKLNILTEIGKVLNDNRIVWAVGGSLLLYLKGKADTFGDIDIMVTETDVGRIKEILQQYGELAPPNPNILYKTRHFYEFTIDGVEIDVMAGFTIVSGAEEHDCSLHPGSINERLCINGVAIPLQSLDDWRTYYTLMGRMEKVAMIDGENRASFAPRLFDECE